MTPLNGRLPRAPLLAGAVLALTACGAPSAPQASDQPPVTVIHGRVTSWGGEGTVRLPDLPSVSAPVGADGTFTLTLPEGAALSGRATEATGVLAGLGCSGTLTSSAAGTRGYLAAVLNAQDAGGTRQISAAEGTRTGPLSRRVQVRAWLYADGAAQLRGSVDCAGLLNLPQLRELPVLVAVNVQPGWNVLDLTLEAHANVFGQVSGSGQAANSLAGSSLTVWRTAGELQAQIGF